MIEIVCVKHRARQKVATFKKAIRRMIDGKYIDPPVYGVALIEPDSTQAPVWHIMEHELATGGVLLPDGTYQTVGGRGVRAARVDPSLRNSDANKAGPGEFKLVEVDGDKVVAFAQRALTRGDALGEPGYIWAWTRPDEVDIGRSLMPTGAPRQVTIACPRCKQPFSLWASKLIPVLDQLEAVKIRRFALDQLIDGVSRLGH